MRKKGYELKAQYIDDKSTDKNAFLDVFSSAENLLEQDYIDYIADKDSISKATSLNTSTSTRRQNAEILLGELGKSNIVEPIFHKLNAADVPLFVPILVKRNKRDALQKYLIKNSIYCPIHWPISSIHTISQVERQIYTTELSLICDQRYGGTEMYRQLELIRGFGFSDGK